MISSRASRALAIVIVAFSALWIGALDARGVDDATATRNHDGTVAVKVAGTGVDGLNNAIIYSQEPTATGMIQRSTEIVDLNGDLKGRVLYHVTSVFDFVHGTLVNTGDQVYSGTVAGSAPVMIHDDEFRFDVNLITGQESGRVNLLDHIAGPKVKCTLVVVGTGMNAEGNPTFSYTGVCTFRGR
jgi:hypothetical protein